MADSNLTPPRGTRITLTKAALASQEGMDLLILCETVTADGSVSNAEVRLLQKWLVRNQGSSLPAIEFLTATVERIVEDGRITPQERDELHDAIERVMPSQQRAESRMRRLELEQRQLREAEERTRQRKERRQAVEEQQEALRQSKEATEYAERLKGDLALIDMDFSVAGVTFEGRNATIQAFANEGDNVFLVREKTNRKSHNAIEVLLKNGRGIGYVPERYAAEWAPLFDSGYRHLAYIKFIHSPAGNPDLSVPIIEGGIFVPESQFPGAVTQSEVSNIRANSFTGQNQRLIEASQSASTLPPRYPIALPASAPERPESGNSRQSDPHVKRVFVAGLVLIALIVFALWISDN